MSADSDYNDLVGASLLYTFGNVISDEDCKTIHSCCDLKNVAKHIIEKGPPFNAREAEVLAIVAGDMDADHSFDEDGDNWTDDVLGKYADFVHNFVYTYNDEAKKMDPSIDTKQVHIGPMAQDLEKVNPSTVVKDPKTGYLKVDTGRLALMNAGAIADLAREVQELKGERK